MALSRREKGSRPAQGTGTTAGHGTFLFHPRVKPPLHLFGWPGALGGSETKLTALGALLAGDFQITWVPNDRASLGDRRARAWIARHGMRAAAWEELPARLRGWGVALCNIPFLTDGRVAEAKLRGLRIAWGGEMMWAIPGELGALTAGLIDLLLFTGEKQRAVLGAAYLRGLGGEAASKSPREDAAHPAHGGTAGVLAGRVGEVRWVTVGNYVDPAAFPFRDRTRGRRPGPAKGGSPAFTIGRLSRADWVKYPPDFPRSYEGLGLRGPVRFRVMAWSRRVACQWPGHRWNARWERLPALAEPPAQFLRSLDLFVYDTHPRFSESWGRAAVEAMLTGAVPLVPADARHHLGVLVPDGVAGFQCASRRQWRERAQLLQTDAGLRAAMSRAAAAYARDELCQAPRHREVWRRALG